MIEVVDWLLRSSIGDCDCRLQMEIESAIRSHNQHPIGNRQSNRQSAVPISKRSISIGNRHSKNRQSAIATRQSTRSRPLEVIPQPRVNEVVVGKTADEIPAAADEPSARSLDRDVVAE